jgi:hypothetical protein
MMSAIADVCRRVILREVSFKRESSNPCQCLPAASLTSLQLREYAALSMPMYNLMLALVPS